MFLSLSEMLTQSLRHSKTILLALLDPPCQKPWKSHFSYHIKRFRIVKPKRIKSHFQIVNMIETTRSSLRTFMAEFSAENCLRTRHRLVPSTRLLRTHVCNWNTSAGSFRTTHVKRPSIQERNTSADCLFLYNALAALPAERIGYVQWS